MIRIIKKSIFNALRIFSTFHANLKVKKIGQGCKVNQICYFTSNTTIGNYCHFNGMHIVGCGDVYIGDYFHSGTEVLILTQNHNYNEPKNLPYDATIIRKKVIIGKGVWLGSRVTILPGANISDGVIVQAGAVVHGDIPEGAVIGGNPAKIIKYRNMDIYNKLKAENRYSKI